MANLQGGTITWIIDGDNGRLTAVLKDSGRQIQSFKVGADSANASAVNMAKGVALGAAAFVALRAAVGGATQFLKASVTSANRYQASMLGLSSVTAAFGGDTKVAAQAAQDLISDGLMPISDAATGLKNLLATGFSLDQAINLMNAFKNSAAFGRQGALDFGEAIRGATEGLKNGNSILVDNAGVTKNLSVILKEAGRSQTDVMNITSDAAVRQDIYNGILRETAPMLGDAAKLTQTFAGAQARLSAASEQLRIRVGEVVQVLGMGLLGALASAFANNQQLIISLGGAVLAAGTFALAIGVVTLAIRRFGIASIIAAASNPLVMLFTVISALLGGVVFKTLNTLQGQLEDTRGNLTDVGDSLGKTIPKGADKSTEAMGKMADQLAKIDEQIKNARRDFREQLADIVRGHEEKVRDLTRQLDDENRSFAQANSDRYKDFNEQQLGEAKSHADKVRRIEGQINQLQRLGALGNQRQLADLRNSLQAENHEYAARNAQRQIDYQADVTSAKTAHVEKTGELQKEIDTSRSLLQKHAKDVLSVRGLQQLDEIALLKRGHREQLTQFRLQKDEIIKNAGAAGAGAAGAYGSETNKIAAKDAGKALGEALGAGLRKAFVDSIKSVGSNVGTFFDRLGAFVRRGVADSSTRDLGIKELWNATADSAFRYGGGQASGGSVTKGTTYMVGERGPELFTAPSSGEIIPNDQLGMGGGTVNISVNLSGVMSRSVSDERAIAKSLIEAINQELRAKNLDQIGGGKLAGGFI